MTITHKKGKHRSSPFRLRIGRYKELISTVVFSQSSAYDHGNRDQYDWNKLIGLSYHLFTSHKNSAMVGWRYDPDMNDVELCAYYHVAGKRVFTDPLLRVGLGEVLRIRLIVEDRNSVTIHLATSDQSVSHSMGFGKLNRWVRLINAWFGGNLPAPNDVNFSQTLKLNK